MKHLSLITSNLIILIFLLAPFSGTVAISAMTDSDSNHFQLTQDTSEDSGLVKMLNYNIEIGGANPDWKEVVRKENPDVILLVETGPPYSPDNLPDLIDEFNEYFPNQTPYEGSTFDTDSFTDGQGVLSRYPITNTKVLDFMPLDSGEIHDMNHPYIDVTVDFFGQEVHIIVNHLSCCDSFNTRLVEQEAVLNYVDTLGDVPIIYGGDFNSNSPQDTGQVAPFLETLGTEPIDMMINSSHPKASEVHVFTDTYRELNPERKGYTLNSEGKYFGINHFRSRIDYIFVNQHLVPNMVNSSVVTDYAEALFSSDHTPMYTWFDFILDDGLDQIPPISPTNVTTSAGDGSVELTWEASISEDLWKYSIVRNGCLIDEVLADTTSYTDEYMLNGDALYKYEIYPVDLSSNYGRPAIPAYAIPNQGEVTAPTAPVLQVTGTSTGVELSWTVPDNGGIPIDSFLIYRYVGEELEVDVGSEVGYVIDRRVSGSSTGYEAEITRSNIPLWYMMIAVNEVGESLQSEPDFARSRVTGSMTTLGVDQPVDELQSNQFETPQTSCFEPNNILELSVEDTNTEDEASSPFFFIAVILLPIVIFLRRKQSQISEPHLN